MKGENLYINIIFLCILILGGVLLYSVDRSIWQEEIQKRTLRLENINKETKEELEEGLSKFAALVSGIKIKIETSDSLPTAEAAQSFMISQLNSIHNTDSLAVSFIDTNHSFKYAFTRNHIDPYHLTNTSVIDIRPNYNIKRMDSLMKRTDLFSLYPVNIVEGWVGIPLDFGVIKNEKPIGYFVAITNFKSIIQKVYNRDIKNEFVFHFKTSSGIDLDRESVYDDTIVYNTNIDPEYYKNFEIPIEDFIYSNIHFYGLDLMVGTAYKTPYKRNVYLTGFLFSWYFILFLFFIFFLKQVIHYKKDNIKITKQKQELTKLIATKNRFFSIIAHDLRSPLISTINFMDMLSEEEFKNNTTQEIFEALSTSTKNTLSLLDNLLKWSRVQTGEIKFKPSVINIHQIINQEIEILRLPMIDKKIILKQIFCTQNMIYADKDMVAIIFRNLLSNAIKFTPSNSSIIVKTYVNDDKIIVSIKDQGIGIPSDIQKSLFDIDNTITTSGTNNEQGSGLGLVICKEFIKMHKGHIWLQSQKNNGSTFFFSIPFQNNN